MTLFGSPGSSRSTMTAAHGSIRVGPTRRVPSGWTRSRLCAVRSPRRRARHRCAQTRDAEARSVALPYRPARQSGIGRPREDQGPACFASGVRGPPLSPSNLSPEFVHALEGRWSGSRRRDLGVTPILSAAFRTASGVQPSSPRSSRPTDRRKTVPRASRRHATLVVGALRPTGCRSTGIVERRPGGPDRPPLRSHRCCDADRDARYATNPASRSSGGSGGRCGCRLRRRLWRRTQSCTIPSSARQARRSPWPSSPTLISASSASGLARTGAAR